MIGIEKARGAPTLLVCAPCLGYPYYSPQTKPLGRSTRKLKLVLHKRLSVKY